MCFPARTAASRCSGWRKTGVAMMTASTPLFASNSVSLPYAFASGTPAALFAPPIFFGNKKAQGTHPRPGNILGQGHAIVRAPPPTADQPDGHRRVLRAAAHGGERYDGCRRDQFTARNSRSGCIFHCRVLHLGFLSRLSHACGRSVKGGQFPDQVEVAERVAGGLVF